MPHPISMNTVHKALVGIFFLGIAHQACLAAGKTCVQDSSGITEICMTWSQQQIPQAGFDFSLDFADPANPDITFKTGNMGWAVTSENLATGGKGNIGTVSLDPAQSTDNFGVSFPSGPGGGVLNVGSIDLTAPNWSGESNVTGGTLDGDLVGNLTVASAPDGSGGSLSLLIQGRTFGAIVAPSVSDLFLTEFLGSINIGRLEVGGELTIINAASGPIAIGEIDQNAEIKFWAPYSGSLAIGVVKGNVDFPSFGPLSGSMTVDRIAGVGRVSVVGVLPSGSVTITDMDSGANAFFTAVEGSILLGNGVPTGASVIVYEIFPLYTGIAATGRIDLNGGDVDGLLHVWGGHGVIENGGMVNGTVLLAFQLHPPLGGIFSGTAGFAGVAPLGGISAGALTLFSGTLDVSGDFAGTLDVREDLDDANVLIGGDMSGSVVVAGEMSGAIAVDGHISGSVTFEDIANGDLVANADGIGGGDITGAVSMLGSFHGNICGDNLSPIDPLPVNISIFDFAADATICGALPGCGSGVFVDASPADGTHDARQPHPINDNSFGVRQGIGSPNSSGGGPEPIIVTLTAGGANHVDCWSLCETGIEQVEVGTDPLSANFVSSVTETSAGVYEILLDRPISAGHWSTVTFFGDGSDVSYASLPVDTNADGFSSFSDYFSLINYINGVQTPPYGFYSTDMNHSGGTNSQDLLRLIDLLNGAGTFINWTGKSLPSNSCVPQSAMSGGGGAPAALTSSGRSGQANVDMSEAILLFFVNAMPSGAAAERDFVEAATSLIDSYVANYSDAERVALAKRLEDSSLKFAAGVGARAAAMAAATLRP